jgi:RluA family pseudouridine synthase
MRDPSPPGRSPLRTWIRSGQARVAPEHEGTRLDRYLAGRFAYRSRNQWGRLIREGRIRVNQRQARPSRPLRAGDRIDYVPRPREEPPVDDRLELLHLDEAVLAVAKSGNLPVHPSGRYFRHTLIHLLLDRHPEWGRLHVIHRLDRETSGVVLFGRSRGDAGRVAAQFRQRRVLKRYLALVSGRPERDDFEIDLALGPAPGCTVRRAVGVVPDGVPARTRVRVLHRGDDWAWIEARPLTGRLHQIRVHLRAAGLPVVGDKVYGPDERLFLKFVAGEPFAPEERRALGLPRQALHAYRITVAHPRLGTPLTVTAPIPPDLLAALAARGWDPARAIPPED